MRCNALRLLVYPEPLGVAVMLARAGFRAMYAMQENSASSMRRAWGLKRDFRKCLGH